MSELIQLRGGTATVWTAANTLLAERELGFETDTGLYKIGDGTTTWNSLTYTGLMPVFNSATFDGAAADPTVGSGSLLRLFADNVGGRIMLKMLGPSGLSTSIQPAIYGNGMYIVSPGTSTVMNVMGGPTVTVVGTMTHPTLVAGASRVSTSRAQVLSAATANSIAEVRVPFARIFGGDAVGLGGYTVRIRCAFPSAVGAQRGFAGVTSSTGATAATSTVAALTNMIGIGFESTETNLYMYSNDAAGSASRVNLGTDFPISSTSVFDLTLFSAPNSGTVGYRVDRLDADVTSAEGTLTTDLPASTTFLAPHVWINNGGTASAVQMDLMRIYLETDN